MDKPRIQIIGIKYDEKSSFMRGPAQAPEKIREVLHDGSSNFISENDVDLQKDIELLDAGDIEPDTYESLLPNIENIWDRTCKPLFLGGDHSITFPLVQAVANQRGKGKFDLLHFDAHTDLYDIFEGDRYSHACPFARIMELELVDRLVQVGIRNVSNHHREQAGKFGVEIITMRNLDHMYDLQFEKPVYLSLDIDVFDPAFVPGVSHHEPGGMDPRTFINFLHDLPISLIGADIVEYNPVRDVGGVTASLAAKMLKEIAGKMAQ